MSMIFTVPSPFLEPHSPPIHLVFLLLFELSKSGDGEQGWDVAIYMVAASTASE